MNVVKIVIGFVPFFVFSLLAPLVGAGWAGAAGSGAAVVIVAVTARHGVKVVPAAQAVILLLVTLIAFVAGGGRAGGGGVDTLLVRYGPAVAALLLGGFMIAAAAASRPFTAQLARAQVPSALWRDDRFLTVNRRISTGWGLAVLILGICHLVGAQLGVDGWSLVGRLAVNWVVPLLGFWLAGRYTKRLVAGAAQQLRNRQPA